MERTFNNLLVGHFQSVQFDTRLHFCNHGFSEVWREALSLWYFAIEAQFSSATNTYFKLSNYRYNYYNNNVT